MPNNNTDSKINTAGNIDLDADARATLMTMLDSASRHTMHIKKMAYDNALMRLDVETYIDSMRYHIEDVGAATGLDDYVKSKLVEAEANIRAANLKIHELEAQLGDKIAPSTVTAGMRKYENILTAWYRLSGFRFAQIEYFPTGVIASFTAEIERESERRNSISPTMAVLKDKIPYEFTTEKYAMKDERYHYVLLDTDENKECLKTLFAETFPKSRVHGFESMRESDVYALRTKVFIQYEDLEGIYAPHADPDPNLDPN